MAAMALCLVLGWALAAAPASAAGQLWRCVAAACALVLAAWAALHAFAVPGLAGDRGHWTAMPGLACGVLAAAGLALAVAAARPTRVGVARRRGRPGGRAGARSGRRRDARRARAGHGGRRDGPRLGRAHPFARFARSSIVFQPLPGGRGGHYVYRATRRRTRVGSSSRRSSSPRRSCSPTARSCHLRGRRAGRADGGRPARSEGRHEPRPPLGSSPRSSRGRARHERRAGAGACHARELDSARRGPGARQRVAQNVRAGHRTRRCGSPRRSRSSTAPTCPSSTVAGSGSTPAPAHGAGDPRRSSSRCVVRWCPSSYSVRYRVVSADSHAVDARVRVRRRQRPARRRRSSPAPAACRTPARRPSPPASSSSPRSGCSSACSRSARSCGARPLEAARRPRRPPRASRAAPWAAAVLARVLGPHGGRGRRGGSPSSRPRAPSSSTPDCSAPCWIRRPGFAWSARRASATCSAGAAARSWRSSRSRSSSGRAERAGAPSAGRRGPLARHGAARRRRAHPAREPGPRLAGAAGTAVGRRRRHPPGRPRRSGSAGCRAWSRSCIRAPRALPDAGRTLAAATLGAFSRVALLVGRRHRGHGPRADGRRAVGARRSC